MALSQAFVSSDLPVLQQFKNFQIDIMDKLNWSQDEWAAANQVYSDRYFFCRNIKYWFGKLAEVRDPKFLVFTTFSRGTTTRPTFKELMKALKGQFGLGGIVGASQAANANYYTLFFSTQEAKLQVMKEFCVVSNSFIVHAGWLPQQPMVPFQLNGLPPDISIDTVREELEKHIPISSLVRELMDLDDGDLLPTGKFYGTFKINDDIPLLSLPHFLSFAPYQAHWIIYSRPPICFVCKWVGHVASKCPTPFCYMCRSLQPHKHQCCVLSSASSSHASPIQPSILNTVTGVKDSCAVTQSTSLDTSSTKVAADISLPQNFWNQNKPLLLPQKKIITKSNFDFDLSSSSENDDFAIFPTHSFSSNSPLELFGKSDLRNSRTMGERVFSSTQNDPARVISINTNSCAGPIWKPSTETLLVDFSCGKVPPKTYSKKQGKKKK